MKGESEISDGQKALTQPSTINPGKDGKNLKEEENKMKLSNEKQQVPIKLNWNDGKDDNIDPRHSRKFWDNVAELLKNIQDMNPLAQEKNSKQNKGNPNIDPINQLSPVKENELPKDKNKNK